MYKKLLFIILPFLLFSCTSNVDEAEVKKARQFFESVFQDSVLDSPEFQASLGYKSNYDKWDDITWQSSRRKAKQLPRAAKKRGDMSASLVEAYCAVGSIRQPQNTPYWSLLTYIFKSSGFEVPAGATFLQFSGHGEARRNQFWARARGL